MRTARFLPVLIVALFLSLLVTIPRSGFTSSPSESSLSITTDHTPSPLRPSLKWSATSSAIQSTYSSTSIIILSGDQQAQLAGLLTSRQGTMGYMFDTRSSPLRPWSRSRTESTAISRPSTISVLRTSKGIRSALGSTRLLLRTGHISTNMRSIRLATLLI